MKREALVLVPFSKEHKKHLESAADGMGFIYESPKTVRAEQVRAAEIIFGFPPVDMLRDAPKLRWLQLQSAGIGPYGAPGTLPEGVVLTSAVGAYGVTLSECILGALFGLSENFHTYRDKQRAHIWRPADAAKPVYGSTVLIVGLGDVGSELGRRLNALGAHVIGIKRTLIERPDYLDELHTMDALDALLPRADTVVLILPGTPDVDNIINKRTLALMKADAILINAGRGNAIDEDDLVDALDGGRLWGVALDVFRKEPLAEDSRLWDIERVIITPHAYGGLRLEETANRLVNLFRSNLAAYLATGEVPGAYDPAKGY